MPFDEPVRASRPIAHRHRLHLNTEFASFLRKAAPFGPLSKFTLLAINRGTKK